MKKVLLFVAVFFTLSAQTCKIISSPAPDSNKVDGVDAVAKSYAKITFDKNSKAHFKTYQKAYIEFFNEAMDYLEEQCKKYKIKTIYNFKIESNTDKDYYYFNAIYDFEFK